ncbi:MAG: TlpA family protein disulfide reductase [Shewanella sp.]|nr:TlpA family protein disulfide reductase [Shewanella sp.]MCF1431885.1 TlpA family protein disulfide reductase [Shewanella sp.]MCF1438164.1 TlpA family protein disulfide reductase [Shewanella sp.]MCF1458858.1 TlpA family protein disulfide reductase [Shewanella sp.]
MINRLLPGKHLAMKMGLGLTLFAASLAVNANTLQSKAYHTGEPIPRTMQMTGFVEMQYARTVTDMSFTDLQGKVVKLSDYHGKLLMLNLWATWCPPCLKEIPALQQVKANNAGNQVEIVSLSIDQNPENIPAFLKEHGIKNFGSLTDPTGKIEQIMPANVVPATYVFDGAGNLVGFMRGFLHWDDKGVQPYLDKLIAKYANKTSAKS